MRRRYWRASALAGLFGLIVSVGMGVDFAAAHPGEGEHNDADHAKEDLAGTSIVKIEKETAAKAAEIKKATGNTPGRRTEDQNVPNARVSAAAAQDPGQGGSWSSVINTDQGTKVGVVPIFQAVLPNGKVLMWDSVGQDAPEQMPTNNFTRAMVWDPSNNTYNRRDVPNYNIFCAGYTQLADGNVLVAGGNKNAALDGISRPTSSTGRPRLGAAARTWRLLAGIPQCRLWVLTKRSSLAAGRRSRRCTRPTKHSGG
jgi:hypothetical protein